MRYSVVFLCIDIFYITSSCDGMLIAAGADFGES